MSIFKKKTIVSQDDDVYVVKKNKPFFLRWWFILLVIIAIGIFALSRPTIYDWNDVIFSDILPEPTSNEGEIHTNSQENLYLEIQNMSGKDYVNYINACKEMGYTIDAESDEYSFSAYNTEGYKVELSYYESSEELSLRAEAPMEMSTIIWPETEAGRIIPAPVSNLGAFEYESENSFSVYIGNTTKEAYQSYVGGCIELGFNVDASKDDTRYFASNKSGWELDVRYVGNNVIYISIDEPDEETTSAPPTNPPAPETQAPTPQTEAPAPETQKPTSSTGIDPDFKAALDSYEAFMDEYVDFMKKYQANPTSITLLADYAQYMKKYADMAEKYDKLDDDELNDAELAYYIDVQARVNKKLLEIA